MSHRSILLAVTLVVGLFLSGCHTVPKTTQATPPASTTAGQTTIVAIAPPQQSPPSIFDFLGVKQVGKVIGGGVQCVQNCLGSRFPFLEPTPPLLSIADPANLAEGSPPAVAAAAEIKAEEDKAAQKIKALRYLATIGCGGCYPGVEKAILDSLDDCTEKVRYEAALALRAATGKGCNFCSETSCCSENVRKKLWELGYDMDASGCYKETSERVRRQARLALAACETMPIRVTTENGQDGQERIEPERAEVEDGPMPSGDQGRQGNPGAPGNQSAARGVLFDAPGTHSRTAAGYQAAIIPSYRYKDLPARNLP